VLGGPALPRSALHLILMVILQSHHRPGRVIPSASVGGETQTQLQSVTVLGAGVCGLTSALRLKQAFPSVPVQIIGERIATASERDITTSEGAAGLWKPFALSGTPDELVNRWGKETLDHYMELFLSPDAASAGIILTSAYELFEDRVEQDPSWSTVVPSYHRLTDREIAFYDPSGRHVDGYGYETVIAEGKLYLGWVLKQLDSLGVSVTQRRIETLDDLQDTPGLLVNCCGLGSRELFGDNTMYGIRGHVLRVKAPWVRHHVESHGADASKPAYIIPNSDTVVLGGTKEPGNEDITSEEAERREIFERCKQIVPSLEAADIVGHWVGLRPGREGIRLELEVDSSGRRIVHNYGHGGSGLTLAYGCAGDVVKLAAGVL
jgi:glycine/D-amino acid oxidase-like deaminating enzyme